MPDNISLEILPDGTLKIETDKISGPNHLLAERFLAEMSKLAGGTATIKRKHSHGSHSHTHDDHEHQH